jgi:hypothetical protein
MVALEAVAAARAYDPLLERAIRATMCLVAGLSPPDSSWPSPRAVRRCSRRCCKCEWASRRRCSATVRVQVAVAGGGVSIRHAGRDVAAHVETDGRHQRVTKPSHFAGVVGGPRPVSLPIPAAVPAELLRPLCDYEQLTVLSSAG